jgi:hypothetical protein
MIAAAMHPQKADRGERLMNLRSPACASSDAERSSAGADVPAG